MSRPGATGNWVRFARKGPNASDITPLKPSVSGRFRLASWHRPKPRFYRLDTLCGKAPKFRRFCWRKNVGKGESHGPKSVKPSAPCISLLWDDAASFCGFLTIAWLEPQADRSIRGEPSTFACRQRSASPPYLAIPQTLRDRQVGQNELLVSTPLTPRAALPLLQRAGLLLTPNCQRLFALSRHIEFTTALPESCERLWNRYFSPNPTASGSKEGLDLRREGGNYPLQRLRPSVGRSERASLTIDCPRLTLKS